jgi:hypothetical protein
VELLTVIAIIAVLAALLMTALSTARKSRQTFARATSGEIALALNILDDFPAPSGFESLVTVKYLPSPAVLCFAPKIKLVVGRHEP